MNDPDHKWLGCLLIKKVSGFFAFEYYLLKGSPYQCNGIYCLYYYFFRLHHAIFVNYCSCSCLENQTLNVKPSPVTSFINNIFIFLNFFMKDRREKFITMRWNYVIRFEFLNHLIVFRFSYPKFCTSF